YSQRLRVGSSRSERRLIEALLLGCGLVSRSGLRGSGPLTAATRARPVLLSVVPLLALRRRLVGLLRLAETATRLPVPLREVLDAVTRHLHLRLPLVHVRAGDIAGNDYRVPLVDAETGDQVVMLAPESHVVDDVGELVVTALVVLLGPASGDDQVCDGDAVRLAVADLVCDLSSVDADGCVRHCSPWCWWWWVLRSGLRRVRRAVRPRPSA